MIIQNIQYSLNIQRNQYNFSNYLKQVKTYYSIMETSEQFMDFSDLLAQAVDMNINVIAFEITTEFF